MEQVNNNRLAELHTFSNRLLKEKKGNTLIHEYNQLLNSITPEEVIYQFNKMSQEEISDEEIRRNINKISNIYYKPLYNYPWHLEPGSLIHKLMQENRSAESIMGKIKNHVKPLFNGNKSLEILKNIIPLVEKLDKYTSHYSTLTLHVFPEIIRHRPELKYFLRIQNQLHEELKKSIISLKNTLTNIDPVLEDINKRIGTLSFSLFLMMFREEKIIFPFVSQISPKGLNNQFPV